MMNSKGKQQRTLQMVNKSGTVGHSCGLITPYVMSRQAEWFPRALIPQTLPSHHQKVPHAVRGHGVNQTAGRPLPGLSPRYHQ